MKQPVEISLAVVLVIAATAIFWRQAHAPHEPAAHGAKPAAGIGQVCTAKCQAVATDLKCSGGDKCAGLCAKLSSATACKPQVERFIQCFTQQPSRSWYCEDDGTPMLGHVCEPEQNAISDCMMHNNRQL